MNGSQIEIANTTTCLCAARVFDLCKLPCTSVDYTMMLGVPILPIPTLIEFLN